MEHPLSRQQLILAGIVALRDATRALRGGGAARKGDAVASKRSVLIEMSALEDRLSGYADDQTEDDWIDFWLTKADVETLRRHIGALEVSSGRMSPATLPALQRLAEELAIVAQRIH